MNRTGAASLLVAVVVLLAVVVASGAGYAIDTPREATVVAAPDSTATVSFVRHGDIDSGRQREAPIATLTNRFPVSLTEIAVTVTDPTRNAPRLVSYTAPASLQPGESAAVFVDVICASGRSEDWAVTVAATGPGVSVAFERSVTVTCAVDRRGPADTAIVTPDDSASPTGAATGESTPTSTPTPAPSLTPTPTPAPSMSPTPTGAAESEAVTSEGSDSEVST